MIVETIKLLRSADFYGESEAIEIAKGRDERVFSIKEAIEKIKRIWLFRKKLK